MIQKNSTDSVLSQIYDMQQRGSRMLSIIDLIIAETVSIELASHLIALIIRGITISSGSLIGGTGKTTLLASLLAFLPKGKKIITVTASKLEMLLKQNKSFKNTIYLCHEISPAHYYSYLWGEDLKLYFDLKQGSNNLAFTIHADSPDEVYPQIINKDSRLKNEDFFKIDVLIFIKAFNYSFNTVRRVTSVYEKDEKSCKHILTYKFSQDRFTKLNDSPLLNNELNNIKKEIQGFLKAMIKNRIHKIEDVRNEFLTLFS